MWELLKHQGMAMRRSPKGQTNIFINILLIVFFVYLILNFLFIGFFIDKILIHAFPKSDIIEMFTNYTFYYLIFDLILRFFLQKIPAITIAPYLHLPIRKSRIFHYLLVKSFFSFFNLLPILLILPFTIKVVLVSKSILFVIAWFVSIMFFLSSNNYFNFILQKLYIKQPFIIIFSVFLLIFIVFLDIKGVLSLSLIYTRFIYLISNNLFLIIFPTLYFCLPYYLSFKLLRKHAYIESYRSNRITNYSSSYFSWFGNIGQIGSLFQLELKLIYRNKRPRMLLANSLLIFIYGLIMYSKKDILDDNLFLLFIGLFITGTPAYQYGQLVFAWESSYFDCILSKRINAINYMKSKHLFFIFLNIIFYFLSLPFIYFGTKIVLVNTAIFIFNLGFVPYLMIFIGLNNNKKITLDSGIFFNYEGMNFFQIIQLFLILSIPMLIFLPFYLFGIPYYGYLCLGIIGILGLLLKEYILFFLTSQFIKKRHKLSYNFRK